MKSPASSDTAQTPSKKKKVRPLACMTCVKRQDAHGPDSINLHANRQEAPLLTLAHRRQVEGTDNSAAHFRLGALLKLSYGIELKVYDAVIHKPYHYLFVDCVF
jgi:hypothetical protein